MIHVQQTDIAYDSVDFDDLESATFYFKKLCRPFLLASEDEIDKYFNDVMDIIKRKTKDSNKSAEIRAQHIMRLAAEKIHGALRESNRDSMAITANFVNFVIQEAGTSLLKLLLEDDDISSLKSMSQNRNNTDVGVSKDHEVIK